MNRDDIHILSRHSNWSEKSIDLALKDEIYADVKAWKKFLQILLISLGVGFTVSGIIFFFAYNWADLNKFVKIGMVEGLIIVLCLAIVFSKLNQSIKNIILTGVAILVGVMIAVFGQIYQTGANAYDFFLGWTAFITLWVVITNYSPLWLVYLILANTTFFLYTEQVADNWSDVLVFSILVLFNSIVLLVSLYLPKIKNEFKAPVWFTNIIALAIVFFATIGMCIGILDSNQSFFVGLISITSVIYGLGLIYGLKNKSGFYLSIIPFSVIVIISTLLLNTSNGAAMYFTVSVFIIFSITILIKFLIDLQKKWNNE